MDDLRIKFLIHTGEVALHKVKGFDELAGEDVILIHRLLKNSVPSSQYVLMTAPFYEQSGGLSGLNPEFRQEQVEDFGKVPVVVYDLASKEAVGTPSRPNVFSKLAQSLRVTRDGVAMITGLKKRGGSFRNLPS